MKTSVTDANEVALRISTLIEAHITRVGVEAAEEKLAQALAGNLDECDEPESNLERWEAFERGDLEWIGEGEEPGSDLERFEAFERGDYR
jgi:hypothetical protein